MNARRIIVQISGFALLLGAVVLAVLIAWSIWKLRGFGPFLWLNAFNFTLVCFVLRNYFVRSPPARPWNWPLTWFGVALTIAVGGALATPTLNHWLRG
ncbi:MAG: hypothetical protein JO340_14825 [Acidobacteriaceae bacterium]|nr:hypothetical protein [Acidobacteriaceae bacterium]